MRATKRNKLFLHIFLFFCNRWTEMCTLPLILEKAVRTIWFWASRLDVIKGFAKRWRVSLTQEANKHIRLWLHIFNGDSWKTLLCPHCTSVTLRYNRTIKVQRVRLFMSNRQRGLFKTDGRNTRNDCAWNQQQDENFNGCKPKTLMNPVSVCLLGWRPTQTRRSELEVRTAVHRLRPSDFSRPQLEARRVEGSGGSPPVSRRRHWSSPTRPGPTWPPGNAGVLPPDGSGPRRFQAGSKDRAGRGGEGQGGDRCPVTPCSAETERMNLEWIFKCCSISRWRRAGTCSQGPGAPLRVVPLVVGPDQTGAVHGQDAIADPQPAVGGGRPVWDQSADVDARSVEGSVLQGRETTHTCSTPSLKETFLLFIAIWSAKKETWPEFVSNVLFWLKQTENQSIIEMLFAFIF